MSKNPFGGLDRLTDNDFSEYGARGVLLQNLNDCLIGYLGFGLANNHVTPEMFLDGYDHIFIDRALGECPRLIEEVAEDEAGKRRKRTIWLTDLDVQYRSFAWQYDQLDFNLTLDEFRCGIRNRRHKVLEENRSQVLRYLQPPPQYCWDDVLRILTAPEDIAELGTLIARLPRPKRKNQHRVTVTATSLLDMPVAALIQ